MTNVNQFRYSFVYKLLQNIQLEQVASSEK